MEVQPDFRDLLALLNEHKVEYRIVGGYALAFHGAPRFTGDINLALRDSSRKVAVCRELQEGSFPEFRIISPRGVTGDRVLYCLAQIEHSDKIVARAQCHVY